MHPIINIAVNAARLAGKIILRGQDQLDSLQVIQKSQHDYVSQIDNAAETIIIDTIKKAYPHHNFLGEESGLTKGGSPHEPTWIIDPLDGTTNFLHGFPQYCISIGVAVQDKVMHGIVYDPIRDELFSASRGEGARMNGKRLRVSSNEKMDLALLGTGFPVTQLQHLEPYMQYLKSVIPKCSGVRRAGAAALDLAYVAAGRLDGFWELNLKPWDVAAGSLLIQEAGGWVTTMEGDPAFLHANSILAGSPKIYQQMLDLAQSIF